MWVRSLQAWITTLLHVVFILLVRVRADIKCICTTQQCQITNAVTCTAQSHCYVQYFAKTVDDVGHDVIRGCIASTQPLLCENKRPTTVKVEWPVLHCCRNEFCNRDVIPTAPPWLVEATAELRRNKSRESAIAKDAKYSHTTLDYARQSKYEHQNREQELLSVNPIFIGVPIAGAFVLLAIVLFAIFLLRRNTQQRHFRRNYNLAANQNGALQPVTNEKLGNCHVTMNGHNVTNNNSKSFESERTSAGSESKLLMKV